MLKVNDEQLSEGMRNGVRYLAIFLFLVIAISDGLDGYLARKKHQVTRLGTFLDPVADKLLMTSACLLLSSSRGQVGVFRLPSTVVVLVIGKDLFLTIGFIIVYLITSQARIRAARIGKVGTALQLSMVMAILIGPEVSTVIKGWIWLLRVLWWSAAGTAIFAALLYIRSGSRFVEQYERNLNGRAGP
jgi:CDP-diacylglycerol--glycerol-3-phosphate 3-phosphatidyltransferase